MPSQHFFAKSATFDDGPICAGRATRTRNNVSACYLLSYSLEEPLRAFAALEFFVPVLFVSETALEIRGPFGNADFGETLFAVGSTVVSGEGEFGEIIKGLWLGVC